MRNDWASIRQPIRPNSSALLFPNAYCGLQKSSLSSTLSAGLRHPAACTDTPAVGTGTSAVRSGVSVSTRQVRRTLW